VGKDKENERVDEASEESFPASDPPSWTASPRVATPSVPGKESGPRATLATQASKVQAAVRQMARKAPDSFLMGGLALAATSLGLMAAGRKHASLLAGIAVPSILLVGLYRKLSAGQVPPIRPDLH
jgi:hypothetical protein